MQQVMFDEVLSVLCIFGTITAIMIMTGQYQHHDCEKDDIIKITAQL